FIPLNEIGGEAFEFTLPRFIDGRDRLFSRWCVIDSPSGDAVGQEKVNGLVSHAVYATEMEGVATRDLPLLKTRTKKGMGGVTYNDIASELVDLGVEHVTVNVLLNSFLHLAPVKDGSEFVHEGVTYYISKGAIDGLDRTIKFYSENKMIVSAIILIGFPGDPAERAAFNHPEARSPGIFAMPNLTTEAGVRTYQAALAYLAERYSKVENGLITHWILHNEVDYAWSWTNMGEQPMNVFMDHYVRSMRLAYYTARQFNPHAKVFISLTHNWTMPEDGQGKNYVTRDMLELLARYTKLEGDFEWGVAYHPYPESLFHAAAWNDKKATFSFDTEMITPKNIEVLDAYLHQARFLYHGTQLRSVMLSEQGFHTMDYSEAAQKLQAAALVYTWHKIRPLKSIVCFQNHRWIDAAGEGGLLLGLRTLGSPGKPFGDKKLALSVFEALDTPHEADASEFAKEIIGIRDFAEIPFRGEIR
ncbi:MAG: hypothetical protein JWL90_2295, partial [Chthoniobacteraceae bacterium]|nr:hypothetical protein [Chthoniobacteraceae bacterium]